MQPPIRSVLHPTDLSPASAVAFAHALAVALARRASFTIMNASHGFEGQDDMTRLPPVRRTLVGWGRLEPGSPRRDVYERLQLKVRKVQVDGAEPADAILDYLKRHPSDLMVLATEGRDGLPRFLRGSVAQRVARSAGVRTLFVPDGCRGFVSPDDGTLSLQRILVPLAAAPDPQGAVDAATGAAEALGISGVEIHLMHVGERLPAVEVAEGDWSVHRSFRQGEVISEILAAAEELTAGLIVMTTDGRDTLLDLFRGSHLERVVRGARCPVAAIPA